MTRLAIALVFVLGCGGKTTSTTKPGGGGGGEPILAKKISVSWGIQQQGPEAELYLQTTDETGKQVSHDLGRYPGTCSVSMPAPEMNALTGVACQQGGTSIELHAVSHGGDAIIIVKLRVDEGVPPDPMAREEVTRIKVPLGVGISVDPIASTTGAP
jgi:hypothetical protein